MQTSILDRTVSGFLSCKSPAVHTECSLEEWVLTPEFKDEVMEIRSCRNEAIRKNLKLQLPAITPSGRFDPTRKMEHLIEHSGVICIDIDGKDNTHVKDWGYVKQQITKVPEVAYCGLSVSGNGLYAIIPIENPDLHLEYFIKLEMYFKEIHNLVIDPSGKDITRLRVISYDPDPIINHNAIPLKTGLKLQEKPVPEIRNKREHTTPDRLAFFNVLEEVTDEGLDITEGYNNWFQIGCVIANLFSEEGRKYFHQISQFHYRYSRRGCDKQYNACLKHEYNYGVGTLIHILKQHRE